MPLDPTGYNTGDPEVPILVSAELDREVRIKAGKFDPANGLAGTDNGSIIQVSDKLSKKAGDTVRYVMKWQLDSAVRPVIGDEPIEGHVQGHQTSTFEMKLNQYRYAHGTKGKMVQQRVPWSIITENRDSLSNQLANFQEYAAAFHLCGASNLATADSTNAFTWGNAPAAPDSSHILYPSGITTDQGLTANNTLNLIATINRLVTRAKTIRPAMRPATINGGQYYVLSIHPFVSELIRQDGSDWLETYQKVLQGGHWVDNPIFSGALGIINNVIVMEDHTLTPGVNSSTGAWVHDVRRCVFMGAGALKVEFGRDEGSSFGMNRYQFLTHEKDNGNRIENTAVMIAGMASPRFERPWDGETVDSGKIVVPVWAPPQDAEVLEGQQQIWDAYLAQ